MEQNIVEAEIEMQKIKYEQKLISEFEELRPKPFVAFIGLIVVLALGLGAETYLEKSYVTFPLLAIILYMVVKEEGKITHKRIDVLYKLLEKKIQNP